MKYGSSSVKQNITHYLAIMTVFLLLPEALYAQSAMATTICEIVGWFTGPVGGAIASLAFVAFLLQSFFGQVDMAKFLILCTGAVMMASAVIITNELLALAGAGFSSPC